MSFEWDEASKAGINFRKHGVRMPEAIPVFDDPYAITIADEESGPDERRFLTLGMGAAGRVLVVVYTWRGEPRGSPKSGHRGSLQNRPTINR